MDDIPQRDATRIAVHDNVEQRPLNIKKNITIPRKSAQQKGYAFILNHEKYEDDPTNAWRREGTEHDAKQLEITLSSFNLKVVRNDDLSKDEIGELVKQLKLHDFENDLCVLFVILTHGKANNVLLASDDEYNLYDFVIHPILDENKTLLGKPKLFFLQACKGKNDYRTLVKDNIGEKPVSGVEDIPEKHKPLPTVAELFVYFATYEGHYAYRYVEIGTPFIQEFCKYLETRGVFKSLEDIIKDVGRAVQTKYDIVQVPSLHSTMTKDFYFRNLKKL